MTTPEREKEFRSRCKAEITNLCPPGKASAVLLFFDDYLRRHPYLTKETETLSMGLLETYAGRVVTDYLSGGVS